MPSIVLSFLQNHAGLLLGPLCAILIGIIYTQAQKGDAALLAKVKGLPLFQAHPDLAPLLDRGNVLLLGLLKAAHDAALADASGASVFNEALAEKIGRDVLAALRAEFGQTNLAKAAAATPGGTEQEIADHFAGSAKVFITAPSGRLIVAPAPPPAA